MLKSIFIFRTLTPNVCSDFFFLIFCCLLKNVRVLYIWHIFQITWNILQWWVLIDAIDKQPLVPKLLPFIDEGKKKGFAKKLINPISLLESFFVQKSVIRSRLSPDLCYLRAVAPCSIFSLVSVWRKSRTSLLIALYHKVPIKPEGLSPKTICDIRQFD